MKAFYLRVNQAWVVLFGDSITAIDDQRFFETLSDLDYALQVTGLVRNSDNSIGLRK